MSIAASLPTQVDPELQQSAAETVKTVDLSSRGSTAPLKDQAGLAKGVNESAFAAEPVWACIRTHPKHEHIAAAQLSHVPGVEVFNPQLRLERQTRRGKMRSTESLFANYLFARFVIESTLEKVRYTASVKTVLQFGERIATIPDSVIEELRQALIESADTIFTDAPLEGEEVEISSGPFQGETGVILRVLPARERVEILLDMLGRPLPTEFRLSSIIFKRRTAAQKILSGDREPAFVAGS
jgi:transcriptional antiterminator RfaH